MVTKGVPLVVIGTTRIYDMDGLQHTANVTLREAMINERSKRWNKVVHNYRLLVRMLNKKTFPPDVPAPTWLSMLMYESHYHLGIALQHIGEHKKAVNQYTKAIDSVFIPKNGCLAGCNANSCLMTPLYARRAFSYGKSGDWKSALRDAEKAVMLDSRNPDVYCIRALVRSSRNELSMALSDANRALKYNPSHLCALIIKGRLVTPMTHDEWLEPGKKYENVDHIKACSINPDCHNFLTVQDFNHHGILSFYERFLYSLSIPHTISEIVFSKNGSNHGHVARVSSAKHTGSDSRIFTPSQSAPDSPSLHQGTMSRAALSGEQDIHRLVKPFRCGTPSSTATVGEENIVQRRKEYSSAIRQHMSRPRTADQAIAYFEKERLRRQFEESRITKAQERACSGDVSPPRVKSGRKPTRLTATETSPPQQTQTALYTSKHITVFQEMNIKDMPRMYYRPWLGDKLPVMIVDKKQWISPPFKV